MLKATRLINLILAIVCASCATQDVDLDAPPPGPKIQVAIVFVNLVFVVGSGPDVPSQMARITSVIRSELRHAGFRAEFSTATQPPESDRPYLWLSLQKDREYCLSGVAGVKGIPATPDLKFEIRQRESPGGIDECARALIAKVMTRVVPKQ